MNAISVFRVLIHLQEQSVGWNETHQNSYVSRVLDKHRKSPLAITLNKNWKIVKILIHLVFITVRVENDISIPIPQLTAVKQV